MIKHTFSHKGYGVSTMAAISSFSVRPGGVEAASSKVVALMVAVEQPDAQCGHVTMLSQQCGKCWRWCCPSCYSPWMALSCSACRRDAIARAAAVEIDLAGLERQLEEMRPPGP
ncbi:MAG TPA: hypothetical protein VGL92_02545 [Acidimicrobiia bacterium]